jgi:hypothetical protein
MRINDRQIKAMISFFICPSLAWVQKTKPHSSPTKQKWGFNSGPCDTSEDHILVLSSGWMIGEMEGVVKGI